MLCKCLVGSALALAIAASLPLQANIAPPPPLPPSEGDTQRHFPQQSTPRSVKGVYMKSRYHDTRTYSTPRPVPAEQVHLWFNQEDEEEPPLEIITELDAAENEQHQEDRQIEQQERHEQNE